MTVDDNDEAVFFSVLFFVRFSETVSVITHLHHETPEIFPADAQSNLKKFSPIFSCFYTVITIQ